MAAYHYYMKTVFEKDWRIKDNIIIAINCFNKEHLTNGSSNPDVICIDLVFKMARSYAKRNKVKLVEATQVIKEFIKKNKNMSKICLQKEISLL